MTQNTAWNGTNETLHSNTNEDLGFDLHMNRGKILQNK